MPERPLRAATATVALVLLFTAVFYSCRSTPPVSSDFRIEVKTAGGFTGRGTGTALVEGPTASSEVARLAAASHPDRWAASYREPSNPHGNADQILYTLTLTRAGKSTTTSWYDGARMMLPRDLLQLFEAVWREGRRASS